MYPRPSILISDIRYQTSGIRQNRPSLWPQTRAHPSGGEAWIIHVLFAFDSNGDRRWLDHSSIDSSMACKPTRLLVLSLGRKIPSRLSWTRTYHTSLEKRYNLGKAANGEVIRFSADPLTLTTHKIQSRDQRGRGLRSA